MVAPAVTEGIALPGIGKGAASAEDTLPEPRQQKRPAWWREEGLVMAGVDWESLLFRIRAGGDPDNPQEYRNYEEIVEVWKHEHSEDTARRLKQMGFNFVMIPLYKGGGLKAEESSLWAAKHFTEICHRLGMRVGCYTFSGTLLFESFLAENPDAKEWYAVDYDGKPVPYGSMYYRRFVNRDHPGLKTFLRRIVRFAVQEAKVDLIHFDNYVMGPSYGAYSLAAFRQYLEKKYTPKERKQRFGFAQMDYIQPPPAPRRPDMYNSDPVYKDFVDYRCEVLADTYRELGEFARSLNPEIIMECNPGGYLGELNRSLGIGSVDHTRLIQWGGAYWDEGHPSRMDNGVMISRFRSQMIGRYFNNMVFCYTPDPVGMAESMANNLQCVGCPAWVIGDQILPEFSMESATKFDPLTLHMIQFFRREQQYYHDSELVADVGVLNTYANTAYGPEVSRHRWQAFTQALYQDKVPFNLVPERCAGDLSRFRVLVMADLALVPDKLLSDVREFVRQGGGLVITGESAQFNDDNIRRKKPGLADLFSEPLTDKALHATPGKGRAVYLPQIQLPEEFRVGMLPTNGSELLTAVRWAANAPLTVEVKAPETVTMSLYHQPGGRRILHLVNYDKQNPVSNIAVSMQLPQGKTAAKVSLLSPGSGAARTLAASVNGRELHFTVPRLSVYSLVVIA